MTVFRKAGVGLALVAGLMVASAHAQNLPKIEEFYFDSDNAAQPLTAIEEGSDNAVDQLMKLRERGRKAVEATSQLARIAIAEGRVDLGRRLHQAAITDTQAASVQGRAVRWNYGWDLFRLGETEAALNEWKGVQANTRGNPDWVPQTYALALWTLGQKDEAVRWYAAVVRTEPNAWVDPGNYPRLLPHWREQDRATLAQVQQAWVDAPPSWP